MRRIAVTALVLLGVVVGSAQSAPAERRPVLRAEPASPAASNPELRAARSASVPLPGWEPALRAARAYAAGRAGDVSFAVRTERRAWSWRGTTTYRSASVVKAMLLVAYLRRTDVRRRGLEASERALLEPMVRRSDNRAANAIHARVGLPALSALARRVGMRHFVAHPVWGGSTITADDQARLFLHIDRQVPRRHRAYAMQLLRTVVPEQRWGIARAVPRGWQIAFKGGWGRGVTRQVDHQAALLTNAGFRVSVAVLTADNPGDGYGAATLQGVAERLLRGLDGEVRGEVVRSRGGLGRDALTRRDRALLRGGARPAAPRPLNALARIRRGLLDVRVGRRAPVARPRPGLRQGGPVAPGRDGRPGARTRPRHRRPARPSATSSSRSATSRATGSPTPRAPCCCSRARAPRRR